MRNVMIDLETLGTSSGCSILSIGAVEFDGSGLLPAAYSGPINRDSCRSAGLVEDYKTLAWWSDQDSTLVRQCSDDKSTMLGNALAHITSLLDGYHEGFNCLVWGNGADFDLPILAEAYRRCGMAVPWKPYAGRCYRTLKNLRPDIKLVRTGVHHNALDDARSQAEHAVRILNEIGGW